MTTVRIMSAGAMGSAVGAAHRAGGARVVTPLDGRGARTAPLAQEGSRGTARRWSTAPSAAWRFVDEMREIAAAQGAAGLPPELFEGVAAACAAMGWPGSPEDVPADVDRPAVLAGLR